jgi:transcriptional regulator with XRE-family HTH domain
MLPAWAWQRDDVRAALRERDVGALFRAAQQYTGTSQGRIAVATGLLQGRVSEIMHGARTVSTLQLFERIAGGLDMPDDARMLLGLAPRHPAGLDHLSASGRAKVIAGRRQAVSAPTAIPNSSSAPTAATQQELTEKISSLLSSYLDNAQEFVPRVVRALEVTRHAAVSELAAPEDLDTVVEHHKQAFRSTPPSELYHEILGVRAHVGTLLDSTRAANNHSDLVVAAGWLSNLLALLTHDLNDRAASLVWCADAERRSREAHHPELEGWTAQTRVLMSFYDGQAHEAVTHARRGQQLAPLGTIAHAKLVAHEMRAWALIGNPEKVSSTRWRAEKALAKLPADTPTRGAFSISLAEDPPYTATSLLLLGRAVEATRRVITTFYGSDTGEGRREHPSGFARTHLILALALVGLGELGEAYASGRVALDAPGLIRPVAVLASKLDQTLMRNFTDAAEACAYHERYVAAMQQNPSMGGQPTHLDTPSL